MSVYPRLDSSHPDKSGCPDTYMDYVFSWIPASAGMTNG